MKDSKKYELTDETKIVNGRTLYRIRALKDISKNVFKGDLGGFVEGEKNLSQNGDCWVFPSASVFESAWVEENATIEGASMVYGEALITRNAKICNYAKIYGDAIIGTDSIVKDYAHVFGHARIYNHTIAHKDAKISINFYFSGLEVSRDTVKYKPVTINDGIYIYTLYDNYIKVGCQIKTIKEWKKWLKSDYEFTNPRDTTRFKIIEKSIKHLIKSHKLRKKYDKEQKAKNN